MKWLLLLSCVVVLASVHSQSSGSVRQQWEDYKRKFNKVYNAREDLFRFNIFAGQLDDIKEHNRKFELGLVSFTIGLNQFSDWTKEEYDRLNGFRPLTNKPPR